MRDIKARKEAFEKLKRWEQLTLEMANDLEKSWVDKKGLTEFKAGIIALHESAKKTVAHTEMIKPCIFAREECDCESIRACKGIPTCVLR